MITLTVNGKRYDVDVPGTMPLLWVVRDELNLTGTKFRCGIGQYGACTMHVDGVAQRTCVLPVSAAVGKQINTSESLSADNSNPVQRAWIAEQVPQCGYTVLRMAQAPRIDVHIMPSKEKPTGVGEICTPPIAPAVGNAVFVLTGKRVRALPFSDALA
jgi:isoquinoline 1-oxidoreductase subunit alpha